MLPCSFRLAPHRKQFLGLIFLVAVTVGFASSVFAPKELPADPTDKQSPKNSSLLGAKIPEYSALTIEDTTYQSADQKDKVLVVAFMGVQCPLANLYFPRMQELAKKYQDESVGFLAVNSNEQDTLADVRKQAQETHDVSFQVLKDAGNKIADLFGATRTPEVFVLDQDRKVLYHGMIDDQYGYLHRRKEPTASYVIDAVDALLQGKPVSLAETKLEGCHIGRKRNPRNRTELSYYRDVLPILQNRCQECHREGEIGPFALSDYEEVSNWAETIKEAVTEKRMPPWPAAPGFGPFTNDMSMSDEEIATLVRWVDHGCPEGDLAEKPPEREWADGWRIGKPDQVFQMPRELSLPATGVMPYLYFVVSDVFEEDRWVQAMEFHAGKPEVVHHILALLQDPKDQGRTQDGLRRGYFGASAPGSTYVRFQPGYAKRIPAGTRIVFQMHYTPNGTAMSDRSEMGVIYAKEPPQHEVKTFGLANTRIRIKAGEADHQEVKTMDLDQDMTLTALMPHMHLRGKSFKYELIHPDGREETLLHLPRWDFNWQHQYFLKDPLTLKKGSTLKITGHWDNSANNPNNVFPLVDVRWGDQTFDEMFIGYINYSIPRED